MLINLNQNMREDLLPECQLQEQPWYCNLLLRSSSTVFSFQKTQRLVEKDPKFTAIFLRRTAQKFIRRFFTAQSTAASNRLVFSGHGSHVADYHSVEILPRLRRCCGSGYVVCQQPVFEVEMPWFVGVQLRYTAYILPIKTRE